MANDNLTISTYMTISALTTGRVDTQMGVKYRPTRSERNKHNQEHQLSQSRSRMRRSCRLWE